MNKEERKILAVEEASTIDGNTRDTLTWLLKKDAERRTNQRRKQHPTNESQKPTESHQEQNMDS